MTALGVALILALYSGVAGGDEGVEGTRNFVIPAHVGIQRRLAGCNVTGSPRSRGRRTR